MSIPYTFSDVSGSSAPQLYLLQMDSNINLRTNNSQDMPVHILNDISDCNNKQFFQLKQLNGKDEEQGQHQLFVDANGAATIKFVAIPENNSYQQDPKLILPPNIEYHIEPVILPAHASSKSLSINTSGREITTSSPINNPEQEFNNLCKKNVIQSYVHIPDRFVPPRALAVLPTALQLRQKDAISPRRIIPPRARFGPVEGVKHNISDAERNKLVMTSIENNTPLFLVKDKDGFIKYIDVSDKDKSNWIGLLPLGDENTANVWIYEENNELYIITTEAVLLRKQFMLGYSKSYAQDYGLIGPTKDITSELVPQKSWWCYECQRSISSAALMQRHMDINHHEENPARKRRYRCRHCSKTFSKIFALRRHVTRYCEMKPKKSDPIASTETIPEPSLNSSLNTDDNRIPSDESFQNYSNGLDFSTNLFDTDRMPSLLLSGNSGSEVFNPYGLDSENPLASDLGFANGCSNKEDVIPTTDNEVQEVDTITSPEVCPYCKEEVVKGKQRQHVSECPARRFECECKKVFTSKDRLAVHIYNQHSNEKAEEEKHKDENNTSTNISTPYECELCQHSFKRRGMLVNHLWRVHKQAASRVPLERRVRHYPCDACPKIYRTAAKRDRHVAVHHPGSPRVRAAPLEGGTRACAPAACPACPRQYVTRAKLLQHLRAKHPHYVPPPPNKSNTTQKSQKEKSNDCPRSKASEELLTNKTNTNLHQLLNFY